MFDKLRKQVKSTTEDEVKSILLQMLLRIQMAEELESYSDSQLGKDLKKVYTDFINFKIRQENLDKEMNYKVVHIVFSDSTAGSLKNALKEMGLQKEEKVISLSDIFSIGPVWDLQNRKGIIYRYEWLTKNINLDEETLLNYEDKFNHAISEIHSISKDVPIFIWIGENAHEQTGYRFVLHVLKDKVNQISVLNTTSLLQENGRDDGTEVHSLHTGEIAPEELRLFYETYRNNSYLTQTERNMLQTEWEQLSAKKEVLRIWENNSIKSVKEDYYDEYIVNTLRKLHSNQNKTDFIKSARLIGEVIGYLNQYLGDCYFEYRVRHLIVNGIFEIEGVPKAMRYYSVKLKSAT